MVQPGVGVPSSSVSDRILTPRFLLEGTVVLVVLPQGAASVASTPGRTPLSGGHPGRRWPVVPAAAAFAAAVTTLAFPLPVGGSLSAPRGAGVLAFPVLVSGLPLSAAPSLGGDVAPHVASCPVGAKVVLPPFPVLLGLGYQVLVPGCPWELGRPTLLVP